MPFAGMGWSKVAKLSLTLHRVPPPHPLSSWVTPLGRQASLGPHLHARPQLLHLRVLYSTPPHISFYIFSYFFN